MKTIQITQSPESHLATSRSKLHQLYVHSAVLEREDLSQQVFNTYRKLFVSEIFFHKHVTAVTGLQGVGKTTLLKTLYQIPFEYLPEDIGRGEVQPILITEVEEAKEVTGWVKTFNHETKTMKEEQLDASSFMTRTMSVHDGDLLLELRVPFTHFHNPNQSLLLLPGLEPDHEENEWQKLVKHALYASSSCIFVLNETMLADGDNRNLMQQALKEFHASKPMIVLTFSDKSDDQNEALAKKMTKDYGVPLERIFRTGDPAVTGLDWITPFVGVMRQSPVRQDYRSRQLEYQLSLLREQSVLFSELEEELEDLMLKIKTTENNESDILIKQFRTSRDRISKAFKNELKKLLDEKAGQVYEVLQESLSNRDFWDRVKLFFQYPYRERFEFEKFLRETWEKENTALGVQETVQILQFRELDEFQLIENRESQHSDRNQGSLPVTASEAGSSTQSFKDLDKLHMHNLQILFKPETLPEYSTTNEKLRRTVELLPMLALEAMRWSLVASAMKMELDYRSEQNSEALNKKLSSIVPVKGSVARGVALILGLDAIDGTVNTVPALLNALGIKATTAAASSGVAIIGGLTLAIMAYNLVGQINNKSFEDDQLGKAIVATIRDNQYQAISLKFDEMLDYIEDRLYKGIRVRFHVDKDYWRYDQLRQSLADCKDNLKEMRQLVYDNRSVLG